MLPTKSSLSISAAALTTTTTVQYAANKDMITTPWHNDNTAIQQFINFFRNRYGINRYFHISTINSFPHASGLASSASGFAALAIGLTQLNNLALSSHDLSILARYGSGSAARSTMGGVVLWHKGERIDGADSYAEQLFTAQHWPELRIIIAQVHTEQKKISSRSGMAQSQTTASGYTAWIQRSERRIPTMIEAFATKDIHTIGQLTEDDWHDMHTVMQQTLPPLNYWLPVSYALMAEVHKLRTLNMPCYFTTDAGPHVKIICLANDCKRIVQHLQTTCPSVTLITSQLGMNPHIQSYDKYHAHDYNTR